PPAATTFHITVGSSSADSVLKPNTCKEVVLSGGADQPVTVTETVPDGFSVSYKQTTDLAHVDQPTVGPIYSATASGWVGGKGGPNNSAQGELFVFTNVEEARSAGCTVTQGYWKTHSARGPAPYDNAWLNIGPLGADTQFYSTGLTWYQVFRTPPKKGNANFILAHQFMAARLNVLAGATTTPAVDAALSASATYFGKVSNMNTLPVDPVRSTLLGYATTLDNYNNGLIGPGHC
ncbi:MAG: hypothetical protein ABI877_19970, partial [Gemmatimonadaceae bacterium]